MRVYRAGPAEFLLDTDAGVGGQLVARLQRFKLRTKADIEQLDWRAVAVRGPGTAVGPGCQDEGVAVVGQLSMGWAVRLRPAWPGSATAAGRDRTCEAGAYEAARVEAGFPRHGAELDERTIPAEAGLVEASVSFTKGCYTGQELVARIDSRGSNVPRHLRALVLSGPAGPGGAGSTRPSSTSAQPTEGAGR